MPFDYKKEYKEYYMPKNKPEIISVPKMNFISVRGKGNPNEKDGEYQTAIGLLYSLSYAIKMSKKGDYRINGYFDYVVPPLEGFWWQEGSERIDYSRKKDFCWISLIRLPDFVTNEDFQNIKNATEQKKNHDYSKVEFMTIEEGLCVQCMHIGSYDEEYKTISMMEQYLEEHGFISDLSPNRLHHEIYLSDARRVVPEKWKTVIRHPIRKKGE